MQVNVRLCAALIVVYVLSSVASGNVVTFNFRLNDLMDLYPAAAGDGVTPGQTCATQDHPRMLRHVWDGPAGTTGMRTFGGQYEYNAYLNWLDGLGQGEGINTIAILMDPGWNKPSALMFGETMGQNPGVQYNYMPTPALKGMTAPAGSGWSISTWPLPGEPGYDDWYEATQRYSAVIEMHTDDPAKFLRPASNGGADLGVFTVTLDVGMYDLSGLDNPAVPNAGPVHLGMDYRMRFMTQPTPGQYQIDQAYYDDQGWGTRPTGDLPSPTELTSGLHWIYGVLYMRGTCDFNGDGVEDAADIDKLYSSFGNVSVNPSLGACDVNGNGITDQADVTELVEVVFGKSYGDANLDGSVDFSDFQSLLDHWTMPKQGWSTGDWTGDGIVSFNDFQQLLNNWNPAGLPGNVPEPTTLALLALGGLAISRRRSR